MKDYHLLWITEHGGDWTNESKAVFETAEESDKYKIEYEEEYSEVNGIEHISFQSQVMSDRSLRDTLTVNEYCKLHPELKTYINIHYN